MDTATYYCTHKSAIGELLLVAGARGFRHITLLPDGMDAARCLKEKLSITDGVSLDGFFTSSIARIDAYLAEGTQLTLPIDLTSGTALQRSVWLEIARIPYALTISYSELAARVGFPRAVRAVASACGANPLPLVIPCHRVVAKDGTLGGFSLGGLHIKERLLALEKPVAAVAAA